MNQGQRPHNFLPLRVAFLRRQPEQFRAVSGQPHRLAGAQPFVGQRGAQNHGVFFSGGEAVASLYPGVKVEHNPPVAGGGAVKLAHKKFLLAGGGGPMYPTQAVAGEVGPHLRAGDGALKRVWPRPPLAGAAAGSHLDVRQGDNRRHHRQCG